MNDIARWTATALVEAYATGELSPVEATRAALRAVDRHNDDHRAFCLVDPDAALAQARASEERWRAGRPLGRLDGVPASIKDLFLTRGWPTLRGSKRVDPGQPWAVDSPVAARLRENGLVLLGKTTTSEYGWKGVTDNPIDGITRNPWDRSRTAGGSSGGSAVAVATGMGALSVATDAAGSVRIPAAFCGVVGFKPTYGRIPLYPPSVLGTLAHAGPMARSVADIPLIMDVLAAPDPRDPTALEPRAASFHGRAWAGLRVAFSPTLGYVDVDPEVAEIVARAVAGLAAHGLVVEEADPGFADPFPAFDVLWSAGYAHSFAVSTGGRAADVDPGLRALVERGAHHSATDYLEAHGELLRLGIHMGEFHTRFDLLITPTVPIEPFAAGHDVPPHSAMTSWAQWAPFSFPFNMSRQPALSVPVGFTSRGLPVGLQVVGPRHHDELVLTVGALLERPSRTWECDEVRG
ncbi:amidase [Pseudonocardia eucalypti]|uniref:Amidase n=1 Tax=Pseudonocardia eucalypti TaxID=648755 RepID=A0ABP9PSW2_9PSEU|nr:aspartyl-tRNA(Asn)/glutamyl-tRNA(Gln) amidotransferase subunit A [Pseudonocardia eucalypti]